MKVWINNEIVDSKVTDLDIDGWPDGTGIFETLRTEGAEVFELNRHMRRAIDAAEKIGIALPNEDLIREGISKILVAEPWEIGRLRLLFSHDRFVVVHKKYEDVRKPQKLRFQLKGIDSNGFIFKQFPYTQRLQLLSETLSLGFDEVICQNLEGQITEGAVSNFLFLIDEQWVTSPLTAGVLPGVMRAIAIERCGVKVRNISVKELASVHSALVLSSLKIALPVESIDDRALDMQGQVADLEVQIRAKTHKHSVG